MTIDTDDALSSIVSTAKGGLYSGAFNSAGLDANVRALLMDYRWTTSPGGSQPATTISYFASQQASDYTSVPGYPAAAQIASFQPLTANQKLAAFTAFELVASYTKLTFVEAASGLAGDAAFRFARYNSTGSESRFPANEGGYAPTDSREAGDTFLGSNGNAPAAFFGTDDFNTIMHEMGHAFGLKHGHDGGYNGALAARVNDNEFSVMTYASYFGSPTGTATEARVGSAPQSFMMYDIAALQALYGANFSKAGTSAVYRWDAVTGQETINGVAAPNTGVTATNKIFSTVWTQGARATYDLSNFVDNQVADLRPGHWSTFSQAQLADLNSNAAAGTPQFKALGNVYNALLYNGNTHSLVNNITTGSGNDKITGNAANNKVSAGAGDDVIDGDGGHDIVSGGAGADTIDMSHGKVTVHDTPVDMDNDTLTGADSADALDFIGIDSMAQMTISRTATEIRIEVGGVTIEMGGHFADGAFMIDPRGGGESSHTTVAFVNFLPALQEGAHVDAAAINGVADDAFLIGDGHVGFTMELRSAMSAYKNALGVYKVDADGNIFDAHIVFSNTLNVSEGARTVNLGTPGDGVEIGFFLIQDGFSKFANLPDNLVFVTPDGQPANVDGSLPVLLKSATLGILSGATVFHSFAALNPGEAEQILSGMAPGGHELLIGFEDLPSASGDDDFQDVVIAVHLAGNGNLVIL
jgi:Ca2+-binding RTX toxin-like protein